tara:strand:+ start:904 stop:1254 length:351 start_codon:yes stop_codon:yes gene_type:complete
MTYFLLFALATIGLTNILVHGKILDVIKIGNKSLRGWMTTLKFVDEVLGCYECTGFWAGLFVGLFFVWPHWWLLLLYGFAGSVLAQTYTDVMYLLRSKVEFELPEEIHAPEETTED